MTWVVADVLGAWGMEGCTHPWGGSHGKGGLAWGVV